MYKSAYCKSLNLVYFNANTSNHTIITVAINELSTIKCDVTSFAVNKAMEITCVRSRSVAAAFLHWRTAALDIVGYVVAWYLSALVFGRRLKVINLCNVFKKNQNRKR